jgi:PEP-CTERM/exosortase A-associated glycosyltransferase
MRILHVLDHSLPLHSGYAFRTAAILREQHLLGYQTLQLTTPRQNAGDALFEDIGELRFHRTPPPSGVVNRIPFGGRYVGEMIATARRTHALVREFAPDVLHVHSPVLNALPALRVAKANRIPIVYEVRALWEDAAVDHGTTKEGSVRYRISRGLETFVLRHVDHVTTICEGLRAEILRRGITPERVTVIPNAVDAAAFSFGVSEDKTLRAQLGLGEALVLGFVGSFYAYEGLDVLIEAAARIAPLHTTLRVLLVGGGPQEASLKSLAHERGVADRVFFAGRVAHADVQRYYDLIDVLAYPRRRLRLTELVTPLKPLEAMARGRMFVASDVGGHRELIRDGETGFLFKADDVDALVEAVVRVLRERDRWPAIRAEARRFVERERTWTRSVARYADVYGQVCGAPMRVVAHRVSET